jgi:hypothetical protein
LRAQGRPELRRTGCAIKRAFSAASAAERAPGTTQATTSGAAQNWRAAAFVSTPWAAQSAATRSLRATKSAGAGA